MIALSVLFVTPTWWLVPFVVVSVALIVVMRRLERWFFARYGDRVIEPEVKGAFAALLILMWLADMAHAEAVLPAFVLGFAVAPALARHRELQSRFRVVSFALLTPFFFLRAGLNVSAGLIIANVVLLVLLLGAKLVTKTLSVYPLARRYATADAWPVALLHVDRPDVRHHRQPGRPHDGCDHAGPVLRARRGRDPLRRHPHGRRAAAAPPPAHRRHVGGGLAVRDGAR